MVPVVPMGAQGAKLLKFQMSPSLDPEVQSRTIKLLCRYSFRREEYIVVHDSSWDGPLAPPPQIGGGACHIAISYIV